jgi:transcriptional regulator with XRE-family HTH domain
MAYNKEYNERVFQDFLNLESDDERLIGKQMDIAAQIDNYLKKSGWTRKKLAGESGLRASQITDILSGNANPTLSTLIKLEEAMNEDIIVCPDFYKEDLRADGWLHPQQSVNLSHEHSHLGHYREDASKVNLKGKWGCDLRLKNGHKTSLKNLGKTG